MADSAAVASEAHCASAARDLLARGNAVDAVVAGVAAAAAASPTVLFGSVQLLVGGSGSGLLAFDGRPRQPGRGAPRPRGFLVDEPIPGAARVAAPLLPATLAVVIASAGSVSLRRAFRPALNIARARSPERASVLEDLSRRGAPAVAEGFVASELLAVAGRASRGLLTIDDLRSVCPQVARCPEPDQDPAATVTVPWLTDDECDGSATHVVAAMDARGMVAVACYEAPVQGVPIEALGLSAPENAAPVMRGKTRVTPGEPRPVAAPIALRVNLGLVDLALGIAEAAGGESALAAILTGLARDEDVARSVSSIATGTAVALLRTRRTVRALARGAAGRPG